MSAAVEESIRAALEPMARRLDQQDQVLSQLKKPASKSGLSMQDVAGWMAANNRQAVVGNGDAGFFGVPGFRPKNDFTRGCGIGPALRMIADIESRGSYGGTSTREGLEKEWGFQTL